MKKKIALALASLVLMMTVSFAPASVAPWPPCVEWDAYVVMGGQKEITVALEYGPLTFILEGPFATRDPWLKPYEMIEEMCFSNEIDPDGPGPLPPCVVFFNVTAASPLVHVIYSPDVGGVVGMPWLRITEAMAAPGFGWIYTVSGIADVDVRTFNNDSGTFWNWPSPLAGQFAYDHVTVPFPSPGADGLPGFCPAGPGTQDDGFGDGAPEMLPGASVLYLPEMFMVEGWNATAGTWDLLMGAPLMMVMTTAVASDCVAQVDSPLNGRCSMKAGMPWDFLAWGVPWKHIGCNKKVTYAAAGSLCDFVLDPGPPRIALDILYDVKEKKVRADQVGRTGGVVADIWNIGYHQQVNIIDIAVCEKAFGAWDEGLGPDGTPNTADDQPVAHPRYDARADLDCNSLIDIFDLVRIAVDFGCSIEPGCVVCSPSP